MDTTTLAHILATLKITQASSALGVPNALLVTDDSGNISGAIGGGGGAGLIAPITGMAYVSDDTGDDTTGDGSIAAPYKTIAQGMAKITTDATTSGTVALLDGSYADPFTVEPALSEMFIIASGAVSVSGTCTIASGGGTLFIRGIQMSSIAITGGSWSLDVTHSNLASVSAAGAGTTNIVAETGSTVSASGDYQLTWDVSPSQVGNDVAQWNANKILDLVVNAPSTANTFLTFDGTDLDFTTTLTTTDDSGASGQSILADVPLVDNTLFFATIDTLTNGVTIDRDTDVIQVNVASADTVTQGLVQLADGTDITDLTDTTKAVTPADIATVRDSNNEFNAGRIQNIPIDVTGIVSGQGFIYDGANLLPGNIFQTLTDGTGAGESLIAGTSVSGATLVTMDADNGLVASLSAENITITGIASTDTDVGVIRLANVGEYATPVSNAVATTPSGVKGMIDTTVPALITSYDMPVSVKGAGPYSLVSNDRGNLISLDGTLTIPNTLAVGYTCLVFNSGASVNTIATTLFLEGGAVNLAPNFLHRVHIYKSGTVMISTLGPGLLTLDEISDTTNYVKFTPAERTKLAGLEDMTDAEVVTAYNNEVPKATTLEMQTGTETADRRMSPELVHDAIDQRIGDAGVKDAESIWTVPIAQPAAGNDGMEMYFDFGLNQILWRDTPTVANTMTTDTYDPFNVQADVYDLGNATGLLDTSRIDSLESTVGGYSTVSGSVTIHSDISSAGSGIIISAQERTDISLNVAHRNSLANPHGIDAATVGNTAPQWNANLLQGTSINAIAGAIDDGKSPVYDFATDTIIWSTPSGGGGGEVNDLVLDGGAGGETLRISKPASDVIIKGIAGGGTINVSTIGSDIVIDLPQAAEGIAGAAPIATSALISVGTDNTTIVSPQGLAGALVDYSTRLALKKVVSGAYAPIAADTGYDLYIDDGLTLNVLVENFTCIIRNTTGLIQVITLNGVTVANGSPLNISANGTVVVTYDSPTTVWLNGDLQV